MHPQADAEKDCTAEVIPQIVPSAPWRVAEVRPLSDFRLWVRFNDGTEGTVILAKLIHSESAGVFAALRNLKIFSQVTLQYGAVAWPNDLDLAPDAMHEAISRHGEWCPE